MVALTVTLGALKPYGKIYAQDLPVANRKLSEGEFQYFYDQLDPFMASDSYFVERSRSIIFAFGESGDKRAIWRLLRLLGSGNDNNKLYRTVEESLAKLGVTKEQMVNGYWKALSSKYVTDDALNNAKRKLRDLGISKEQMDNYIEKPGFLGDIGASDEQMVKAYIGALLLEKNWQGVDPRDIDWLAGTLKGNYYKVVEAGLAALKVTKEQLMDGYIGALQSMDDGARSNALGKLGDLGNPRAIEPIRNQLGNMPEAQYEKAQEILKKLEASWWDRQSNRWRITYISGSVSLGLAGLKLLSAIRKPKDNGGGTRGSGTTGGGTSSSSHDWVDYGGTNSIGGQWVPKAVDENSASHHPGGTGWDVAMLSQTARTPNAAMLFMRPLTLWGARRVLSNIKAYSLIPQNDGWSYVRGAIGMIGENPKKDPRDVRLLQSIFKTHDRYLISDAEKYLTDEQKVDGYILVVEDKKLRTKEAIKKLGDLSGRGNQKVVDALLKVEHYEDVVAEALGKVANKGDRRVINVLMQMLRSSHGYASEAREALTTLTEKGDQQVIGSLLPYFNDWLNAKFFVELGASRLQILNAAVGMPISATQNQVNLEGLKSKDSVVRKFAIEMLVESDEKAATGQIMDRLE